MVFQSGILQIIAYTLSVQILNLSMLFDKHLDHMLVEFEQNCIVRTIQHFVGPTLYRKLFGVKNYCSPTCVTIRSKEV